MLTSQKPLNQEPNEEGKSILGCVVFFALVPIFLLDAWILMSTWNLAAPILWKELSTVTYAQAVAFDVIVSVLAVQFYPRIHAEEGATTSKLLSRMVLRRLTSLTVLGVAWIILKVLLGM